MVVQILDEVTILLLSVHNKSVYEKYMTTIL